MNLRVSSLGICLRLNLFFLSWEWLFFSKGFLSGERDFQGLALLLKVTSLMARADCEHGPELHGGRPTLSGAMLSSGVVVIPTLSSRPHAGVNPGSTPPARTALGVRGPLLLSAGDPSLPGHGQALCVRPHVAHHGLSPDASWPRGYSPAHQSHRGI